MVTKTKLFTRIKNAINALRGKPTSTIYYGVDVKKCSECDRNLRHNLRDNLLVTAGTRAGYMDDKCLISIPRGVDGEAKLAEFIAKEIDLYIRLLYPGVNFDEFIEHSLTVTYGSKKGE